MVRKERGSIEFTLRCSDVVPCSVELLEANQQSVNGIILITSVSFCVWIFLFFFFFFNIFTCLCWLMRCFSAFSAGSLVEWKSDFYY